MDPQDILLFKRRHRCAVMYGWFQLSAIFLSFWAIGLIFTIYVSAPIAGLECPNWAPNLTWASLGVAVLVEVFAWIYWKNLVNKGADKRRVQPYKIKLNFADKKLLCEQLIKNIKLETMLPNVMYSFQNGKRNIRTFVFDIPEYNKRDYGKIRDLAIKTAIKHYGMKTELTRYECYKSIRLNILLLENFNEEAYKSVEINASYGMQYAEGTLTAAVDLKEMTLYIPAHFGTWYGGAAKYYFCVNQLLKWVKDVI